MLVDLSIILNASLIPQTIPRISPTGNIYMEYSEVVIVSCYTGHEFTPGVEEMETTCQANETWANIPHCAGRYNNYKCVE